MALKRSNKARYMFLIALNLLCMIVGVVLVLGILSLQFGWFGLSSRSQSGQQNWSKVISSNATYFTATADSVIIGNTCYKQNNLPSDTALTIMSTATGKETAHLPAGKPFPAFCHAASWDGMVYVPLEKPGQAVSAIGAYNGTVLQWQWSLPQGMTAVYAITANPHGTYAIIGDGYPTESGGTLPHKISLIRIVRNQTVAMSDFQVAIPLGPNGLPPSLTAYDSGLALTYVDGIQLSSIQYVSFDGSLSTAIPLKAQAMRAEASKITHDGSLLGSNIDSTCSNPFGSSVIRKFDKPSGRFIDYSIEPCTSVTGIDALPDSSDILTTTYNSSTSNSLLARLRVGKVVWRRAFAAGDFLTIVDSTGTIIMESVTSRNEDSLNVINSKTGSTLQVVAWTAKTTDSTRVANLFTGPDRVYVVIEILHAQRNLETSVLYSYYVAGLNPGNN